MKVLIAGGAGFIGSYIAQKLVRRGDEVIIYDAFLSYVNPFDVNYEIPTDLLDRKWSIRELIEKRFVGITNKIKIIRGDIRHKGRLTKVINEHKPSKIICLAALPLATASNIFTEDAMSIHTTGTANILEILRETKFVDQFIYTSSSMIYGNFNSEKVAEDEYANPINIYGGTKLCGEILTRVYSEQFGINYTIIRPSAVYGPTDVNRRVSQVFLENAYNGKPIPLHNGGVSRLDFTYVKDVADGFVLALDHSAAIGETFNITRGEGRSLMEFFEILKRYFPNIETTETKIEKSEKRPERGALNIDKAKSLLGYHPKYSLEDGIEEYVEYVRREGLV